MKPVVVPDPPFRHTVLTGDAVDLARLPIPEYFPGDAGRYLTAGMLVARDPETGEQRFARGECAMVTASSSSDADLRREAKIDFAAAALEDKTNSLWSVAIGQDGAFDPGSVRREALLPDFFTDPSDIAIAGKSNPVTDIAFPKCSTSDVMLVAERGFHAVGIADIGAAARERVRSEFLGSRHLVQYMELIERMLNR